VKKMLTMQEEGNMLNYTAQHSTAQHSTAQHSTAQHSTAQHSTRLIVPFSAVLSVITYCTQQQDRAGLI
jgi:hypothetical protein